MSEEKEKELTKKIAKAVPHMSEFQKGYMLGVAESIASGKQKSEQNQEKETA